MYEINPVRDADDNSFFSRYRLPSKLFYVTCGAGLRMAIKHEKDPSVADASAWAVKLQAVNDAMLTKFKCSNNHTKEYKAAINSNSEDVDVIYRRLFEYLFMEGFTEDKSCLLLSTACDAGNLLAQKMVIDAYHNNKLSELLGVIERVQEIISPYQFCTALTSDGQQVLPEMDICTREQLTTLSYALGISAAEDVFQLIFSETVKNQNDLNHAAVVTARKYKREIEQLLSPFISNPFRKKAEKAFVAAMASMYEYTVNSMMEHGFRSLLLESKPNVLANSGINRKTSISPYLDSSAFDNSSQVFGLFNGVYKEIRDAGVYANEKQIQRIFGAAAKDLELANIGFWFCLNSNSMWGVGTMLPLFSHTLTYHTNCRGQFAFDLVCPKSYRVEGKSTLLKHNNDIVKTIGDLFVSKDTVPNAVKAAGDGIKLTYNQLLYGFGLRICETGNFELDSDGAEDLANNLTRLGPLPDDISGALAAISILDYAGMLAPIEKDKPDFSELAQAAEKAQEQAAAAQRKIKELEAQLASKDKIIQRKDDELFDNSRTLTAKDKEIASMKDGEEDLRQQITELTEILAHVDDDDALKGRQVIDADIVKAHNIVVCGGTERFTNLLKGVLPTIKTYFAGQMVPADVLRNAEVVFIQTSYIAHKQYYQIRNICKASGTKLEFFRKRGVQTVAAIICGKILQMENEAQKAS